jgi:hypothetical protein
MGRGGIVDFTEETAPGQSKGRITQLLPGDGGTDRERVGRAVP